jgi:hypothetical protein
MRKGRREEMRRKKSYKSVRCYKEGEKERKTTSDAARVGPRPPPHTHTHTYLFLQKQRKCRGMPHNLLWRST